MIIVPISRKPPPSLRPPRIQRARAICSGPKRDIVINRLKEVRPRMVERVAYTYLRNDRMPTRESPSMNFRSSRAQKVTRGPSSEGEYGALGSTLLVMGRLGFFSLRNNGTRFLNNPKRLVSSMSLKRCRRWASRTSLGVLTSANV
jgi:hypothetical protein